MRTQANGLVKARGIEECDPLLHDGPVRPYISRRRREPAEGFPLRSLTGEALREHAAIEDVLAVVHACPRHGAITAQIRHEPHVRIVVERRTCRARPLADGPRLRAVRDLAANQVEIRALAERLIAEPKEQGALEHRVIRFSLEVHVMRLPPPAGLGYAREGDPCWHPLSRRAVRRSRMRRMPALRGRSCQKSGRAHAARASETRGDGECGRLRVARGRSGVLLGPRRGGHDR